jgi:hypothetical protein
MVRCTQKFRNAAHVRTASHREAVRAAISLPIDLLKDGDSSFRYAFTWALIKLANQGMPHEFPPTAIAERNSGPSCDN